jgi:phage gp29-like protein
MEDYAFAYGKIATYATTSMKSMSELLGESNAEIIKQMINQPIRQVIETIRVAILLPLQRINVDYRISTNPIPSGGS